MPLSESLLMCVTLNDHPLSRCLNLADRDLKVHNATTVTCLTYRDKS